MDQQMAAKGGDTGPSNEAPAMPSGGQNNTQKVGHNGGREKKKRRSCKAEHMTEKNIDKFISVRREIEAKGREIEDEEFDLNDEANFEACVTRLNMWDQCLDNAVRLEQRLLPHVIFDDAEHEAHHNDLIDVIQHVDPVRITNSGLEPLNGKLTDFINNPLNSLEDDAPVFSRAITGINHVAPSFNQVKQMIEEIRAQSDCPLVDILAPTDNLAVYDAFVCKVLADVLDILKRKRFDTNLELIERDARAREEKLHNVTTTNPAAGDDGEGGSPIQEDPMMVAGPSSSSVEQDTVTQRISTHQKFLEAILKGEIQTEGEDAVPDGEDLDAGEEDESHSEACSEDFIESSYSSITTDAGTSCYAAVQQQQPKEQHCSLDKANAAAKDEERMEMGEGEKDISPPAEQSAPPSMASANAVNNGNNNNNNNKGASSSISSATAEKVRLQQHQLNKLFSSAACLRSSPPLPPSSPSSVIKSEIIDLTLDDDSCIEEEDAYDDDGDLEIIDEVNEGGVKGENNNDEEERDDCLLDSRETVPSSSESLPLKVAKKTTTKKSGAAMMNGSGGRKRKSEDEDEAAETGSKTDRTKRRRRTEDEGQENDYQGGGVAVLVKTVEDDYSDSDAANGQRGEEGEDSTDVVEDSGDEGNGAVPLDEGLKMSKREKGGGGGTAAATGATALFGDDEAVDQNADDRKTNRPSAIAHNQQHQKNDDNLGVDDDSIICLSDG